MVVGTKLPALAEFQHLYRAVTDAEEMIKEIEAILAQPKNPRLSVYDPVLRTHSWEARLDAMLAVLKRETDARRRSGPN
jgi:hypothetical protein